MPAPDENKNSLRPDPRKVFVIHGRNEAIRKATFDFLRAIGLEPLEWSQAVSMTGDASPYIGLVLDVALGHARAVVAMLTPDDVACLRPEFRQEGDEHYELRPTGQARQM